jgi:hypothetical protein
MTESDSNNESGDNTPPEGTNTLNENEIYIMPRGLGWGVDDTNSALPETIYAQKQQAINLGQKRALLHHLDVVVLDRDGSIHAKMPYAEVRQQAGGY